MVKVKMTLEQQKKSLQERAEALDTREDRQITAALLKDTEILRSDKGFLHAAHHYVARGGSGASHSPSVESADGRAEASVQPNSASSAPACVPSGTIRQLVCKTAAGTLSWQNLRASFKKGQREGLKRDRFAIAGVSHGDSAVRGWAPNSLWGAARGQQHLILFA
eukprot:675386-Amphidinium_carterae.1